MTYLHIQMAVLFISALIALAGLLVLLFSPEEQEPEEDVLDAEYRPAEVPASTPDDKSWYWRQDSALGGTFKEELPSEVKRAFRRNAEELKKVQKWRYYAAHANKGRTRKKYRNKLREYHRSHPFPWYWLPSSMELTSGSGYSSGRGLDSGSPDAIWWRRTPALLCPVGEGGRIADWGPRPL